MIVEIVSDSTRDQGEPAERRHSPYRENKQAGDDDGRIAWNELSHGGAEYRIAGDKLASRSVCGEEEIALTVLRGDSAE